MEEAIIKRVMPHSLEAEQSVIGSMIMDREAVLVASEILTGEDFYQRQYGIVFEAMVELFNKDEPVDLVTLQNQLRAKDVPEEVSSMEFVRDILNQVPTSANVKYYANIVAEKATLRRLIRLNDEINNLCYAVGPDWHERLWSLFMHVKSLVSIGYHSFFFFNRHHILLAVYGIALLAVNLDAACTKIAAKALCRHVRLPLFLLFLNFCGIPVPPRKSSHIR